MILNNDEEQKRENPEEVEYKDKPEPELIV